PVPDQFDRHQNRAQRDQAISGFDRQLVLHDQGDQADGQQQERQTPEAAMMSMMTVMHMVVTPAAAWTAAVMAMPVRALGFVEGKFLANADIQFAHSLSLESGFAPARPTWPLTEIS